MKSLSSLGIGLSLVFGCLLLALVAELYYLFWWKKRIINREIEEDNYSSSAREFFYLFCWKEPSSLSSTAVSPQQICNNSVRITNAHESGDTQYHLHSNDYILKPYGSGEGVEAELMRMHSLSGLPRFLFTIKEETKEDLVESEDGKSRSDKSRKGPRSRSLSDLLPKVETPFLTPMSSPAFFTPPLTPSNNYNQNELSPPFESSSVVINPVKSPSPPPKFKFLKDAEEKLYRRKLMEEAQKNGAQKLSESVQGNSSMVRDMEDGLLSQ